MSLDKKLFKAPAAEAGNGGADAEQGLILHLDANDVDSYDGDGSIWYDISEHDVTIPISDNSSNLKCHLNFSDSTSYGGTGTTLTDISDESNDFTFVGATASDFDKDNGGYLDLDNSGDYLERSSTTSGHFDGDYTLELWLNPHENNNFTYFYCKQSASTNGLLIGNFGGSTGQLEVYRYTTSGSSSSDTFTGSGITANQWNHITIVFSGSKGFLYVNGEQKDSSTSFSGTYPANFTNIRIGGGYSTAFDTNGELGVFRLYDKALSASEVGQNYRHGRDFAYTDLYDSDPSSLALHLDAASFDGSTNTPSTWTDSSGNSNNGTITGAEFDSELGNWLDLERSSSHNVAISDSSSLDISTNITLEAWINEESVANYQRLFWKSSAYALYRGTNGWTFLLGSTSLNHNSGIPSTGNWYHIAATYDGSNQKLYIDGELVDTESMTGSIPTNNNSLYIGGDTTDRYFDGKIGQTRIYSSALTEDEVMQNYLFTKNNYPNEIHLDGTNMDSNDWNSDGYFDFDGSSEYFYKNDYPVDFGISDYTIIMWFNSDTNNANKALFATYNTNGLMINLQSDGTIRHYHDGGTQLLYYTSETISTGTWYQLAVTFDRSNDTGSMYLSTTSTFDSTASTGTASGGATNNGDGGTNVGRYNNGFQFDGKIANVRVYDKALSSSEIQAVWNTDKGNIPT